MPAGRKKKPIALDKALVDAFAVNERMNQFLLENLDEDAWRVEPPGGKGRTIAAIFAHIHNVRHMWLSVSAKGAGIPEKPCVTSDDEKNSVVGCPAVTMIGVTVPGVNS